MAKVELLDKDPSRASLLDLAKSIYKLYCFTYCLRTTDKTQKATKVKCKHSHKCDESTKNGKYSWNLYFSLKKASELCWSLFAVENKTLPQSARRNIKSNKFTFANPWVPSLLCKHWFMSSLWNFCHWGTDIPPGETSIPATRSNKKQLYSQTTFSFTSHITHKYDMSVPETTTSIPLPRPINSTNFKIFYKS